MRRIEGIDLEEIAITDLPLPPQGERIVRDRKTPNLGIRLRSSGSRTWIMYSRTEGQSKRITLGDATSIPLEIARSMLRATPHSQPSDQEKSERLRSAKTVAEVVADYLASGSNGKRWKASTGRMMESVVRLHVLPTFGDTSVRDITQTDILQWHGELSRRSSSARMALSTLSGAMAYAEDHRLRQHGSNPCQGLRKRSKSHRGSHLPPRSMRAIWQALDHYQATMPDVCDVVRLLILTGARKNEILHLQWDYIEGPRAVLPDSKTGPRTIWLNAPARALIAARRSRLKSRFVFPGRDGTAPVTSIYRGWGKIREAANTPGLRLHDLRHHFAAVAVSNGIDLKVVGGLLGHHDIESTLIYAHLATASLARSASRVSGFVSAAISNAPAPTDKRLRHQKPSAGKAGATSTLDRGEACSA